MQWCFLLLQLLHFHFHTILWCHQSNISFNVLRSCSAFTIPSIAVFFIVFMSFSVSWWYCYCCWHAGSSTQLSLSQRNCHGQRTDALRHNIWPVSQVILTSWLCFVDLKFYTEFRFLRLTLRIVAGHLTQDGPQTGLHPGCAQGHGRGQRSRDTGTFLICDNYDNFAFSALKLCVCVCVCVLWSCCWVTGGISGPW